MKKMILIVVIMFSINILAFAQADDYKKNEYYIGYSNQQINGGSRDFYNGFEVSYIRNVHRYFGVKADFSVAYFRKSKPFGPAVTVNTSGSIYNVLGGIQVKNNSSKAKLRPFGHILAGVGYAREITSYGTNNSGSSPSFTGSDKGFAGAIGVGLDIKMNEKLDFRAIQADYNPIFFPSKPDKNFRFGAGIRF